MTKFDEWWANLTVAQKERIATKAATKAAQKENPDAKVVPVLYPACSAWWVKQDLETQERIYKHCTDAHGYLLSEWQEGRSMSY